MKFSIYFIFLFLLFANTHLHAKHKPNINGLKQEGTSSSLYSPKYTNGISYDSAILVKWPLNKNGQFNVAGMVYGKLVNNKFVVNRTRIKVQSINIPQKLGDILTDNAPIVFEKMLGGVSQGAGVPMDTAILIKWPPVKSGNKFTTVSSMVTGYIQNGDFLFVQQGNRLISTTVGKYGDILIDDVPIPPYDTPNGRVTNGGISSTNPGQVERRASGGEPEKPKGCYCVEEPTPGTFTGVNVDCPGGDCVKCCADVKKQGGTRVTVPAEVALAISKGQYTGDWGDKKYYFNEVKPKPETTTLSQISTNWDKTKYPYGIVVFNNSKYGYDKAENIQEWMKDNKNLKGKGEMPVPVFIIPIKPKDTTIQAANGAGTRLASTQASNKLGLKRTVVVAPPNNTPFFPEIVYRENTRLVKCTDADGNDYYVNCPEGTEDCCGLAPLPQIDLTTPAENNGNPDGGTKPKPETTTLSQISTNWDKTKYPYGIVVFNNSKYGYDKAENIQEWMKDNKNLKGKGEMPVPVFIIPVIPKDTTIQAANGAGTRIATGQASAKPGLKRTVVVAPPNNTPFFPEIVYRENTRLVKCTDADGNDYYVNCPEGTENCCGLAPLPQIDLTTPAENNGNPDGGTKPKPETTTLSGILANWDNTKNPYGIVVFKNSQFVYDKAENIQEWMKGFKKLKGKKEKGYEAYYIIPTKPKDTTIQAANGAGTRLAAGNASTKPGLKRIEMVSPPNNSPSSPEIIYDANTRLVKCTDKDGNDYYVNCPEGTGNCCELAPLPFIDLTSPEKQESFGSGNNHPDSTMSFKWPDDFKNSAYKDLKFEPNAILIGKDGKKYNVKLEPHPNYRFVVFKDISTDYTFSKMPAGTLFLTPFNGTYAGFNKPSIFVTMPQGSVKANMRPRLATSQASAKPGLKRLTPPPAPIGATVPQGEILFKNNGGGIKIDTAIVIYWPPVTGKDDYRQTAPPKGSTIFYPEASIAAIQKASSGTLLHYTQTNMTNLGSDKDEELTTVYKYGDILIDDVPIPPEWRQNPSKIPSTDTAIIVKWPEDFKKAVYKEASYEAMATFVAADGKFYFIDLDSDGDGFFDVDELASKIPAGTMLLKRGAIRKNTEPFIFVTMPQGSVKANGAGTRLATSQASNKPGLKRLTPPPAPIGATVPLGEVLFKNNGGGIKIDTAIVIYWPPVTGKDDYRQIPPPDNNMVVFSAGIFNNFKPNLETIEDRSGQLLLSRRRAKSMRSWEGLIRTNSDNDNDEYNVAEIINDAKNTDESNLGVLIDTIQVIKWPEDFKKAAYKEASFEAMATFVAADGKFYFIDLDSDGDGFFDIDELASKIPAGTMLLKRGAKSKTANKSNFHTVSFTKNGDTLPTYTMQIALPNGSNLEKLFEMSDQAQNYKMREIISLHIGQAGRQTTNNEKDIPIALPYFDTNGNLLFWATKDAITLTYEKNAVNISSIAKNNKYDMDTFKSFYKTLINDNPTFAYPQFKKDRLRAVPHTELSIDPKLGKQRK